MEQQVQFSDGDADKPIYKWTVEQTKHLIKLRAENDAIFNKRRNSSKEGWECIMKELNLEGVSVKQVAKKWENLKKKYKDLRQLASAADGSEETPASWAFYSDMHEALGCRPSVSPPILIASCRSEATSYPSSPGPPETPPEEDAASTSVTAAQPPPAKKKRDLIEFLEDEALKEAERHRTHVKQTERFLALFEKLVNK